MGAADVVPGVSGGTIAFITGIYDKLLESIRRINPSLLGKLKQQGTTAVWQHINGTFLLSLLAGIFTSIILLSKAVTYALVAHPVLIWAFFFGLIIASVLHMLKQVTSWNMAGVGLGIMGAIFAYVITVASPIELDINYFTVFLAGSIAICAMILPGISGSFILLLLGMYTPILDAVKSFDGTVLSLFLLGCVAGLLSFSHLLSWLLREYRNGTLIFLIGLLIGALGKLWPWRQAVSFRINSSGEQVPLVEKLLMPTQFETVTGEPAQIGMAILMMLLGFSLVLGLEKLSKVQD